MAPGLHGLAGEVRQRRVVGAQLDGQGQVDGCPDRGDELQVLFLDVHRRPRPVDADAVEVELEGVGAGFGHEPREADPAAHGVGVEAADDGDAGLALDALEGPQVAVALADEGVHLGEVVERLGEAFRAGLQRGRQLDLLVLDLLLEERGQDDGAGTGRLQLGRTLRVAGERGGRGDDGRSQLQPQVAGAQVDGHWRSPFPLLASAPAPSTGAAAGSCSRCGMLRCTSASWL